MKTVAFYHLYQSEPFTDPTPFEEKPNLNFFFIKISADSFIKLAACQRIY
jgi:hypothetical protein